MVEPTLQAPPPLQKPSKEQHTTEAFKPNESYTRERVFSADPSELVEGMAGTNINDSATLPVPLLVEEKPLFLLHPIDNIPSEASLSDHDIKLLHTAHHTNPFSILGPHCFTIPGEPLPAIIVRFWKKDARSVKIRPVENHSYAFGTDATTASSSSSSSSWVACSQRCEWLFQAAFKVEMTPEGSKRIETDAASLVKSTRLIYEAHVKYHGSDPDTEHTVRDAYNFLTVLPDFDLTMFQKGSCWHVDNLMGSHIMAVEGVSGVRFAVWAPNAQFVSVVGDWNQWDGRAHPMRKRLEFSVWELFVPNIGAGEKYGYRVHSRANQDAIKIDPYAQEFENPPATASIVSSCDDAYKEPAARFQWTDDSWVQRRIENHAKRGEMPISIYEVHLPSWMRGDNNSYLGYRELAHRLIAHIKQLNFTHVEFLPLAHHPFEGSWGYQISGQYAPYSRLGNPDDLKYLINELHNNDIGVFIDFVPAHFVQDSWGLVYYDGEPCYEYADPREGEHKGWGTKVYNFRRSEVRSFLLGAAYHWLRRYHVDGLRIDAVSSMIYKNHCREDGEWLPNEFGGDANLQAITLLQELNWVVHREFPGVFTMAEESTSWKGVTDSEKGLGFDAKWDLGWMNDTLAYLCTPAVKRAERHSKLTFRGMYMADESWVLPLSHDEVVSGKGSLLDKCGFSGTPFGERLKTLKALFGFQIGMPGRPLVFMGCEFGQGREWKELRSIDWHEAEEPARKRAMEFLSDLLLLYRTEEALHRGDNEIWNFQWVDCDNAKDNVVAWLRKYGRWYNDILVLCNFSGLKYSKYPVGVPHGGKWKVLLNSDDWKYGGTQQGPQSGTEIDTTVGGRLGLPYCLWPEIPPFSCVIFKAPTPTAKQIKLLEEEEMARVVAAEPKSVGEEKSLGQRKTTDSEQNRLVSSSPPSSSSSGKELPSSSPSSS